MSRFSVGCAALFAASKATGVQAMGAGDELQADDIGMIALLALMGLGILTWAAYLCIPSFKEFMDKEIECCPTAKM